MSANLVAVIKRASELERLLDKAGGEGAGLGEKARSLQGRISPEGSQAARTVGALRNRVAHDAHEPTAAEMARFNAGADQLEAALRVRIAALEKSGKGTRTQSADRYDAWAALTPFEKLSVVFREKETNLSLLTMKPDTLLAWIFYLPGMGLGLFLIMGAVAVALQWGKSPAAENIVTLMGCALFMPVAYVLLVLSLKIDEAAHRSEQRKRLAMEQRLRERA